MRIFCRWSQLELFDLKLRIKGNMYRLFYNEGARNAFLELLPTLSQKAPTACKLGR